MAFPSSSFAASTNSDNIDPLLSDCFSIPPSEAPESQITVLTEPLPIPPSLKRVGFGRNQCVLWSNMTRAEFIEWWLTTTFATTDPTAKRLKWDQKNRSSEVWSSFEQAAMVDDGKPMVICKLCDTLLSHSWINGTSGMKHHLEKGCKRKIKRKQTQLSIDSMVSET